MYLYEINSDYRYDKAGPGSIKAPDWNGPDWYRVEGENGSKISEEYEIQVKFKTGAFQSHSLFKNEKIIIGRVIGLLTIFEME